MIDTKNNVGTVLNEDATQPFTPEIKKLYDSKPTSRSDSLLSMGHVSPIPSTTRPVSVLFQTFTAGVHFEYFAVIDSTELRKNFLFSYIVQVLYSAIH